MIVRRNMSCPKVVYQFLGSIYPSNLILEKFDPRVFAYISTELLGPKITFFSKSISISKMTSIPQQVIRFPALRSRASSNSFAFRRGSLRFVELQSLIESNSADLVEKALKIQRKSNLASKGTNEEPKKSTVRRFPSQRRR